MLPRKDLWKRALRKPPRVIAYRGWQELRIHALWLGGSWERIARRVDAFWTLERAAALLGGDHPPVVVVPSGGDALRREVDRSPDWGARLTAFAEEVRQRRFAVLGAPVPTEGAWPWHADWRWNKVWERRFFRSYDPYEPRAVPFDIKMPWELSRLTFVPPLVQAWAITGQSSFRQEAKAILADWERQNPLAYSVNWHPMEASMRAITFVMLLGMMRDGPGSDLELGSAIARMATAHGEFIARTVEYSDVRGNHYMANVVALTLLGLSLQQVYPRARRWTRFGVRELPREVMLQVLPDGIDFEGSVPYHRFVTELALIGLLGMERSGFGVDPEVRRRLQSACRYVAASRRPDGFLPNVGDNDSALVFPWDPKPPRDPVPLLGVASALLEDGGLKPPGVADPPAAVAWVLGEEGLQRWRGLVRPSDGRLVLHFPNGGVVVARKGGDYFWADVGEVGLAGRGGHGHNDLGSFELMLDGIPIVIDAGSPVYSGDPSLRNAFRGTAAHNTVRIDEQEMARLTGLWTVMNEARPTAVCFEPRADQVVVAFEHAGYGRLPDPVQVRRELSFSFAQRSLECTDVIRARGTHVVERFLHVDPRVQARRDEAAVMLERGGHRWVLTWDPSCDAEVRPAQSSPGYGVIEPSTVIVLRHHGTGTQTLQFMIAPAGRDNPPCGMSTKGNAATLRAGS